MFGFGVRVEKSYCDDSWGEVIFPNNRKRDSRNRVLKCEGAHGERGICALFIFTHTNLNIMFNEIFENLCGLFGTALLSNIKIDNKAHNARTRLHNT
jgi:hypothetical protein